MVPATIWRLVGDMLTTREPALTVVLQKAPRLAEMLDVGLALLNKKQSALE